MKASLQLKLTQHLTLTPQLQQSIRLLQLSTLELHREIEQILQENPFLEHAEEQPLAPCYHTLYTQHALNGEDDPTEWFSNIADNVSLREHLLKQLGCLPLSQRDRCLGRWIIESLDETGYLSQPLEELLTQIPSTWRQQQQVDIDDLHIAWQWVRQLEPCGIAAVNLQDCLLLQLNACDSKAKPLARRIISEAFTLLANREYGKLKKRLKCDEAQFRAAQALIQRLNPRPGSAFASNTNPYIQADVLVQKQQQGWHVSLNQAVLPNISINDYYVRLLQQQTSHSLPLNEQLQEAKWFIKNIKQRFATILRVAQAIVARQQDFFSHGDIAMRPLVLRDIAEVVDLHESTISRVTSQKYMMTPRGIFEFKHFFGSHVSTDDGHECAAIAIKALIKQLIQSENVHSPMSDTIIAQLLTKKGVHIARRTVAKYRDALQIPPVNQRKPL